MNIVPELVPQNHDIGNKIIDDILFVCEFYHVSLNEILEYEIPQFFIMRNYAFKIKTKEAEMIKKMKRKG
jgi:hypothetical protein